MSVVIADTSPLNYLISIGEIEILPRLFGTLIVPTAVVLEMRHAKAPRAVFDWATHLPAWVEKRSPTSLLSLALGPGEAEAISLAVEFPGAAILIDERKGRLEAEGRDILVIGTIGLLDLADETGLLRFEQAYARLKTTNFHVEDDLVEPVLARVRLRRARA